MLTCRRVGHIVTDVNNHHNTAILIYRRVGHIVTDGNNHRDTAIRPPCFFNVYFSISYSAGGGGGLVLVSSTGTTIQQYNISLLARITYNATLGCCLTEIMEHNIIYMHISRSIHTKTLLISSTLSNIS